VLLQASQLYLCIVFEKANFVTNPKLESTRPQTDGKSSKPNRFYSVFYGLTFLFYWITFLFCWITFLFGWITFLFFGITFLFFGLTFLFFGLKHEFKPEKEEGFSKE
jgi:hypothetical protein